MASTTACSAAGRAPLGSVSGNAIKRSAAEEDDSSKLTATATLAPYHQRIKVLQDAAAAAATTFTDASDKTLLLLGDDILECIPGKLKELGVDEVEELDDNAQEAAYTSLTQEQVDTHLHIMVVDRKLLAYQKEYYKKIMFADPRNEEDDGVVCLNTYSSWCMYPIIQKLLTEATKEVNKAKLVVIASSAASAVLVNSNNVAVEALNKTFGAILACNAMDHWKNDTESPEECEKVAKKVSKLSSDLLWFENNELGWLEPYSRMAMMHQLDVINKSWSDIGGVKYQSKTNGQGLGRSHAPPPPPAKKQKVATVTTTSTSGNTNNERLVSFLNAISDKKKRREKTCVQMKIASVEKPTKSALVVLSGATNMDKVNQLCAFVTGHAPGYDFRYRAGMCIKGSRIELEMDDCKLWLAAKSLSKQAASVNAALVEDKSVKIIQVFQGLVTWINSGIVYDSNDARNVKAFWVNANGERFQISVQAIIGKECVRTDPPMPRLVKHNIDRYTKNVRTGFGMGVYGANRTLQGDQKDEFIFLFRGTSQADMNRTIELRAATPIANDDGTIPAVDKDHARDYFSAAKVAKAGPPSEI